MADRIVYILASGVIRFVRVLPLKACFALGQLLGIILWGILPGYRRLARENLAAAFEGEMTPPQVRALTLRHFATIGANALCAFKIPTVPQEEILRIAPIENLDLIHSAIAAGRPVVLAINHIGNWELYAQLVFQVPGARFGTVYQSLRNKRLDELINGDRRRLGVLTFDRKKGFNGALALLREPGILGVLVDQHAGDAGIWTPFFRRLCSTSPLAATLAIRTKAAVIPVAITTAGFARWRVVLSPEIPWQADQPDQLTAAINSALESQVRTSPSDWFWVHNRWKMPWPDFLTATARRGTFVPAGCPPMRPFRIVVRSPNWLGDAVMSVPTARAFKLGRPDAHLAILSPTKLADLWRRVPEVDEVIEIAAGESVFATARKIRGRFVVAVLFPNSLRSALEAWLAGIPRRVGFRGHQRARLLNQIVPEPSIARHPEHHADHYWRIATHCGAEQKPDSLARWERTGDIITIGICPGAEYGPAKRWPPERFREVITQVNMHLACRWIIVGTPGDACVAAQIAEGFPNVTDLTGKTSLSGLMDVLCGLHGLLTNDTGTMHLADMLGVPLVAVFGSTEPLLTGPRAERSRVIRHHVECSPCYLRTCPIDFRCMREISTQAVVDALEELVGFPPISCS